MAGADTASMAPGEATIGHTDGKGNTAIGTEATVGGMVVAIVVGVVVGMAAAIVEEEAAMIGDMAGMVGADRTRTFGTD
mgnify:CR=1 FL=1